MQSNDTAPTLRIVEADELAAALVVSRPHQPGELLVVASGRVTALQVLMFGEVMLPAAERRQLADWLELHGGLITRPHDWQRGDG
jgi:hypothetical protein